MKLKFTQDYSAGGKAYRKGQEYDVADAHRARTYVKSGVARPADAEARQAAADTTAAAVKATAAKK